MDTKVTGAGPTRPRHRTYQPDRRNVKHTLSKSQCIVGLQCHKALWLLKNRPWLRTFPCRARLAALSMGKEVGLFARRLFPGGVAVPFAQDAFGRMIKDTGRLLKDPSTGTIYEATFSADGVLCMVDILHRGEGGWEIYEVKGATDLKDVHLFDAAIQYHVLSTSGLRVSRVSIVHINKEYERVGAIDVHALFRMAEITTWVRANRRLVEEEVIKMRRSLDGGCPEVEIGAQCREPYECDFIAFCWKDLPEPSVFDLRGRGIDKFSLYRNGKVRFSDLDPGELNSNQIMQVEAELTGRRFINPGGIKAFLDSLHYPLCFLDFETFSEAIPPFDHTHPYEQIPFQYSIHCLESETSGLKHHEFLAEAGVDQREELARGLSSLIPDDACVVVYNMAFEKQVLVRLARLFPRYREKLLKISDNIVDLMVPFKRRYYYTREMKGSYSLKAVLPALLPGFGYEGMAIANGEDASNAYLMLKSVDDPEEALGIRRDLLEYCRLDTLALVRIVERLRETINRR